jgi:hypothetical protein
MVQHPAVLREASRERHQTRPRLVEQDGVPIVTYRRTRLHLDRAAWEMLPSNGVMFLRIRPASGQALDLALTADELEAVFGEVRATRSWDIHRYYSFPETPPAARMFQVGSTSSDDPAARSEPVEKRPHGHVHGRASDAKDHITPRATSFSDWAERWYARFAARQESSAYLEAVAGWRDAWRPERVRVLLVAESHVAEQPGDERIVVRSAPWTDRVVPTQFVRLVYCLGYGERDICRPHGAANTGTWQFWDILGQVALGANQPRKLHTSTQMRLRWKVEVLETLADRGIWLQDASPIGLYAPGGKRVDAGRRRQYRQLLREGYERYVWPTVAADKPDQVWLIGNGVAGALAGMPHIHPDHVISQPNDRTPGRHLLGVSRLRAAIG